MYYTQLSATDYALYARDPISDQLFLIGVFAFEEICQMNIRKLSGPVPEQEK